MDPVQAAPVTEPASVDADKIVEQKTDELTQQITSKIKEGVEKRLASIFTDGSVTVLSEEAESLMEGHKVPDEERVTLRKMLDGLPREAQSQWLRTYVDAKAYALTQDDLKDRTEEYAGRTAWASIKQRFQKSGDNWQKKGSSIKFDASSGKWIVDHRHFLLPVVVASKDEAVALLQTVAGARKPEVKMEGDKFSITHPDWAEPVMAASVEEASDVVIRKLVDEGWSDIDATATAKDIVEAEHKEKIMGSIEVKADTKQNQQAGTVSGIQTDENASSPKNQQPVVGGKTVYEKPAAEVPTTTSHEGQTHSDYAAGAAKVDALVNKLKGHKGLMKVASEFASTDEGAEKLQKFLDENKQVEAPAATEAPKV